MERTTRILLFLAGAAALLPGCYAARLNRTALHPRDAFVLIPEDLGLEGETFVVPVEPSALRCGSPLHLKRAYRPPSAFGRDAAALECSGDSQTSPVLHAWAFPAADAKATVLVCGGNTDNKQLYLPLARRLVDAGYTTVLWDYRGFGFSTGDPDLWSLVEDGRAMLAAVRARPGAGRVGLVGISLGSVVALGVAGQEPEHVDALVIEGLVNPRQKLDSIVGSFLGAIGSFLVVPGDWEVADEVASIPRPILFLHGTGDWVTPIEAAAPLFAEARTAPAPREFWIADGAGHAPGIAGEYGEEYTTRITRFLDRHLAGAVAPAPDRVVPVPVEVAELFSDAEPVIRRGWAAPPVDLASPPPDAGNALFQSWNEPAAPIRPRPGGWQRTDAYRESRRLFEEVRSKALEDLALANILVYRERGYAFDVGIEITPEKVLRGARKAKARLEAVLKAGVDPRVAPAWMPVWDRLARGFEFAGKPEEAIAAWETMLSLLPADPFAWWWFDNADWELGARVDLAIGALSRMVELTDDPARRAEFVRRGTEWRRRQTERERRLEAWAARQRAYLSSSPSSSSP